MLRMATGWAASAAGFTLMPTVRKKTPISSDLNGSIVTSIARRYSVSASSKPAMKAPSPMESPAAAAINPVPSATSRVAAMKLSEESVEATRRKSGRMARRPITMMAATAAIACSSAWVRPTSSEPPFCAPSTLTRKSRGITARSWQSRMAKLARPAEEVMRRWAESSSTTIAVEDKASAVPINSAAAGGWP